MYQRFSNFQKIVLLILAYYAACKFLILDTILISFFLSITFLYLAISFTWDNKYPLLFFAHFIFIAFFFGIIFLSTEKTTIVDFYFEKFLRNFELNSTFVYQKPIDPKVFTQKEFNIFFTETNSQRKQMNLKQMCSIESAALNNPKATIYIYSFNASVDKNLFEIYENIRFIETNAERIFQNSVLENWWTRGGKDLVLNSPYSKAHLADAIRMVLLHKFGGIYSDLDTINIKSFSYLLNFNGVGFMTEFSKPSIGNGILVFKKRHKLLELAMKELIYNYEPNEWGFNGPLLFIRAIKNYCRTEDIYLQLNFKDETEIYKNKNKSVCDVDIFPERYFYPLNWQRYRKLFKRNEKLDVSSFKESYSVHFYGKLSENVRVKRDDNNLFEFFASQNCPYIYSLINLNSNLYF